MKYLGVDFGLRRIGLAISEGELASPLKVMIVSSLSVAITKIKIEAENNKIDKIIIGLPEGDTGKVVQRLISGLKKEGLDVESSDETLSTQNTDKLLIEMGLSRKRRKESDAYAAAEILQNYLEDIRNNR